MLFFVYLVAFVVRLRKLLGSRSSVLKLRMRFLSQGSTLTKTHSSTPSPRLAGFRKAAQNPRGNVREMCERAGYCNVVALLSP